MREPSSSTQRPRDISGLFPLGERTALQFGVRLAAVDPVPPVPPVAPSDAVAPHMGARTQRAPARHEVTQRFHVTTQPSSARVHEATEIVRRRAPAPRHAPVRLTWHMPALAFAALVLLGAVLVPVGG